MNSELIRKIGITVSVPVIIFTLTMLIPIRFCTMSLPLRTDDEFYIIRYNRSAGRYFVIGDKTGLYNENTYPKSIILPQDLFFGFERTVSVDLYVHDDSTCFIVYGTAIKNDEWDEHYYGKTSEYTRYTINCTRWNVFGKVKSINKIRSIFPKSYLNVWDYIWFDVVRDHMYNYLDGETKWW